MPREIEGHTLTLLEREGALWATALEHLVAITPGSNYHHPTPGTFRLTFTLRRPALLEGLARLERACGLEHWAEVGDGIKDEEPMKQVTPSESMKQVAPLEVGPFPVDVASLKVNIEEEQAPTPLDLSYSDVITATKVLKGCPC